MKMVGKASHWHWNCPCCTWPGERYLLKRSRKAREKREWKRAAIQEIAAMETDSESKNVHCACNHPDPCDCSHCNAD